AVFAILERRGIPAQMLFLHLVLKQLPFLFVHAAHFDGVDERVPVLVGGGPAGPDPALAELHGRRAPERKRRRDGRALADRRKTEIRSGGRGRGRGGGGTGVSRGGLHLLHGGRDFPRQIGYVGF